MQKYLFIVLGIYVGKKCENSLLMFDICAIFGLECLWFISDPNIAKICFMIKNSQKWYILDYH
jgi:hypothetical protein